MISFKENDFKEDKNVQLWKNTRLFVFVPITDKCPEFSYSKGRNLKNDAILGKSDQIIKSSA